MLYFYILQAFSLPFTFRVSEMGVILWMTYQKISVSIMLTSHCGWSGVQCGDIKEGLNFSPEFPFSIHHSISCYVLNQVQHYLWLWEETAIKCVTSS